MSIDSGESKNVEYKVALPDRSIKYTKTAVAFANGEGRAHCVRCRGLDATCGGCAGRSGVHHYGCHLECHCDSCEPLIIPDISMRDIDGKTVIVAEILSGA